MEKDIIVIKIGGRAASQKDALKALIAEMAEYKSTYSFVFIHGGGAEVSRISKLFGYEPVFKDGIRMTSPEEMDVVEMVLAGKVNKELVRLFHTCCMDAVGVCGSDGAFFPGRSLFGSDSNANRTGTITSVNTRLLFLLLEAGYLPVIASSSMDEAGSALNINADEAGFRIASAIPAKTLVFLSDIPGILKDGRVIPVLTQSDASKEIADGIISGGMIPKVRSSLEALKNGVREIIIGEYGAAGDLRHLLVGSKGSRIVLS